MKQHIEFVTKSSGEKVPFIPEKLLGSLKRAGATEEIAEYILESVYQQMSDGINTRKIYHFAFSLLKKESRPTAAKYKLKKAIMELGPSGYPFEKYFGELLKYQGYEIQVGITEQGQAVTHEIDVLADKGQHRISVECKYGNSKDKKISIQVPMYIKSRFEDLVEEWKKQEEFADKKFQAWIATNTTFSNDAISFGECYGIRLIAWNYPKRGSLRELIEESKLYPITSLISLTKAEKNVLLEKGIVLCKEALEKANLQELFKIPPSRYKRLMEEVSFLNS
ncbi:MAG: ATP cone domain-containing protein [Bacteroidota bacterium]